MMVMAAGNVSSPLPRGETRKSSLYKHRYARRNVTTFQHSVWCSSSSLDSVRRLTRCLAPSLSSLTPVISITSNMDLIVRQILLALIASINFVYCEPPLSNQYGVPGNYAGGNYHGTQGGGNGFGGHYDGHDNQDYADNEPKAYEFGYSVKDQATGNDFGRRESSDGETVRGEYRVQLPDGRTQIVTYTADWRTGFHADVRYEGTATYPDQYNTQNNGYNNAGQGYQGNHIGGYTGGSNQGGYNYQASGGHYNNANNYNYQFGSNSIDSSYNNFGARNTYSGVPAPTYGPAYH
ncbi:pro-resilin-like isoform X2 [Linepithema humile]|uniref:pro-resilin-like isoform X2 n=1 Tax=Linepithema humile TaxID=83485 RepID=UPI00351EF38C